MQAYPCQDLLPGFRKQLRSTFTGTCTQAGSSTLQEALLLLAHLSWLLYPYASLSLSSPQTGPSTSVQGFLPSQKQLTSTFTGDHLCRKHTAGSPQLQDTASQLTPGSSYPYASLSLSSPQTGPSTSVQGFRKQLTSTFTGTSGTQAGSSTLQGSAASDGSPQLQDTARWIAPGSSYPYASLSLSSPQTGPSTSVQGFRKQLTSTFTGTSGTQAGSSTLHGSTASGGSPQFAPVSSYPYSGSQSQKSQKWQLSATSSSLNSPVQWSSLSSSGVSSQSVSAPGVSTSYVSSFQSPSASSKYTPGSQVSSYDSSVASQSTSSVQPSRSSYSSRFSVKG
ncbi:A-agglutinin anchorage subunit-like [Puntigrus tetrazona]|uniref:A-agglutinin anchorage subunit-like n=1 Tax=Puntigrus tetrazona TaxID=1606681 RepID=UPI001C89B3E6|nr:A-agglutinin anchorage subunit-like [Puntigrus tetrazona]